MSKGKVSAVAKAMTPKAITIRPTAEDYKIIVEMCQKYGVNASSVIRMGLRSLLAQKEKA